MSSEPTSPLVASPESVSARAEAETPNPEDLLVNDAASIDSSALAPPNTPNYSDATLSPKPASTATSPGLRLEPLREEVYADAEMSPLTNSPDPSRLSPPSPMFYSAPSSPVPAAPAAAAAATAVAAESSPTVSPLGSPQMVASAPSSPLTAAARMPLPQTAPGSPVTSQPGSPLLQSAPGSPSSVTSDSAAVPESMT
jgi:hypothetical protein